MGRAVGGGEPWVEELWLQESVPGLWNCVPRPWTWKSLHLTPAGAGGGGESPGRLGKPTGGTLAESSRSGEQMDPWKGAQAAVGTP